MENKNYKDADKLIKEYNLKHTNVYYNVFADSYFYGIGVDIDYNKAIKYYRKTFLSRHNLYMIAKAYENLKNYNKALEVYKDLMSIGDSTAGAYYAYLLSFEFGGHKKAFKILKKLYDQGTNDLFVFKNLGYLYHNGLGVKKDSYKAIELFKKVIKQGDYSVLNNLTTIYSVEKLKDDKELFDLFIEVADKGDFYGLINVGIRYEFGKGVEKDHKKAFEYYKKANDLGAEIGTYYMARCYYYGVGVKKDVEKSIEVVKSIKEYEKKYVLLGNIDTDVYKNYNSAINNFLKYIEVIERKNIASV